MLSPPGKPRRDRSRIIPSVSLSCSACPPPGRRRCARSLSSFRPARNGSCISARGSCITIPQGPDTRMHGWNLAWTARPPEHSNVGVTMMQRTTKLIGVLAACLMAMVAKPVDAQPTKLRIGYGTAAEEQLWLLFAKPEIGRHHGKAYTIESTRFTGSDKRAQAYEAGAIDLASSSANGVIFGAAEGVKAKIIASFTRESRRGFSTAFYANASSPIKSVRDLKGKTIGINGFATSGHLWLKTALEKVGLSEGDVTIVPISFSGMAESLQSGKIDVGQFP